MCFCLNSLNKYWDILSTIGTPLIAIMSSRFYVISATEDAEKRTCVKQDKKYKEQHIESYQRKKIESIFSFYDSYIKNIFANMNIKIRFKNVSKSSGNLLNISEAWSGSFKISTGSRFNPVISFSYEISICGLTKSTSIAKQTWITSLWNILLSLFQNQFLYNHENIALHSMYLNGF